MREHAAASAHYSHVVWKSIHGASCRCLLCVRERAERERCVVHQFARGLGRGQQQPQRGQHEEQQQQYEQQADHEQ